MGIKQFHLVCTFLIWRLFSIWSKCSENSLGTVVILPLIVSMTLTLHALEMVQFFQRLKVVQKEW